MNRCPEGDSRSVSLALTRFAAVVEVLVTFPQEALCVRLASGDAEDARLLRTKARELYKKAEERQAAKLKADPSLPERLYSALKNASRSMPLAVDESSVDLQTAAESWVAGVLNKVAVIDDKGLLVSLDTTGAEVNSGVAEKKL